MNPEELLGNCYGDDIESYQKDRSDWQVKLKGGSVIPLYPGDKVSAFTPSRPNTAYGDYVTNVLRHIGTGLGLPYELLFKDFSKTNYSSARASLLEAWRGFNSKRAWLVSYWAKPCMSCGWRRQSTKA